MALLPALPVRSLPNTQTQHCTGKKLLPGTLPQPLALPHALNHESMQRMHGVGAAQDSCGRQCCATVMSYLMHGDGKGLHAH